MQKFNKRATTKAILFLIVLMVLPTVFVLAGRGGPADMGGDPSGAPIDGGISLLVAAGIGYGAKKVKDAKRKNSQAQVEVSATDEK